MPAKKAHKTEPTPPREADPLGMIPLLEQQLADANRAYEEAAKEVDRARKPPTITVSYGAVSVTFPVEEDHALLRRAIADAKSDAIVNGGNLVHSNIPKGALARFNAPMQEAVPGPDLTADELAGTRPSDDPLDQWQSGLIDGLPPDSDDMGMSDLGDLSDLTAAAPVNPAQRAVEVMNPPAIDPNRKTVTLTCDKCGGTDIGTVKGQFGDFYPCRHCKSDKDPSKSHVVNRSVFWLNHPALRGKADPHGHPFKYIKGKDGKPDFIGTAARCGWMKSLPDAVPL